MSKTWSNVKTEELACAWVHVAENCWHGGKPERYLQFKVLEKCPNFMEAGALRMDWNMLPGLYQWIPGIPTMVVSSQVWYKWTETINTHWKPLNDARNFWQDIALVVCWTPFHDHPIVKERNKMVVSMAVAYVPESWPLF